MPMNARVSKSTAMPNAEMKSPLPFLKWAGGKRKLTSILIDAFPADFDPKVNKFFEPFIGGGALSFALGNRESSIYVPGKNLIINDMNPDLVNVYKVVRDDLQALVKELRKFEKLNNSESFYEIRSATYDNKIKQAARFIYLNKTCFNGLWRVNSAGNFNVPFGRYKNPKILDLDNLIACSKRLQGARITHNTFSKAVEKAVRGDLVYFDPPYIPLTKTSAFSQYAKEDFGLEDQRELASLCKELTNRGVRVILSNSDTDLTREIFGRVVKLRQILVARTISAKATTRFAVHEVIGTNYPISRTSHLQSFKLIN